MYSDIYCKLQIIWSTPVNGKEEISYELAVKVKVTGATFVQWIPSFAKLKSNSHLSFQKEIISLEIS